MSRINAKSFIKFIGSGIFIGLIISMVLLVLISSLSYNLKAMVCGILNTSLHIVDDTSRAMQWDDGDGSVTAFIADENQEQLDAFLPDSEHGELERIFIAVTLMMTYIATIISTIFLRDYQIKIMSNHTPTI